MESGMELNFLWSQMFHLLEGNSQIFTWVELSDWKIPTQLSPAFWHFSAMLPEKGYNITDISQATVAGVTALTSNTDDKEARERNLRSQLWLQPSVAVLCPQVSWRTWFEVQLFSQMASAPSQSPPWRDTLPVHASLLAALSRVLQAANFTVLFHVEFVRFPWYCTTVRFFLFPSYVLRFQCLYTWLLLFRRVVSLALCCDFSCFKCSVKMKWSPKDERAPSHQSCPWPLIIHPNGHKTDTSRSEFKI